MKKAILFTLIMSLFVSSAFALSIDTSSLSVMEGTDDLGFFEGTDDLGFFEGTDDLGVSKANLEKVQSAFGLN